MKKLLLFFLSVVMMTACYDDTELREMIEKNKQSIVDLHALIGETTESLPELKIEGGCLYVSYNKGDEWENLGQVASPSEECLVESAELEESYVVLTLSNGTSFKIALYVESQPEQQPQPEEETGVKSYYLDEISKTRASLFALMSEPCIVFPLITDIHYLATTSMRPELIDETVKNMYEISKDIRFDCMISMGDLTQGNKAMDKTEAEVRHVYEQFRKLGVPFYSCVGNHDTNIYYQKDGAYQKDHIFTLNQ